MSPTDEASLSATRGAVARRLSGPPHPLSQGVRPAVGLGALQEQALQPLQVLGGQPGLLGALDSGVDGGSSAAKEVGHVVGGFALLDEFDGAQAAALGFFSGSDGSHTYRT